MVVKLQKEHSILKITVQQLKHQVEVPDGNNYIQTEDERIRGMERKFFSLFGLKNFENF